MDLALNNLQRLICHNQQTKPEPSKKQKTKQRKKEKKKKNSGFLMHMVCLL